MADKAKQIKYYATGKRKEAIARVWLFSGSGNIIVDGKKIEEMNISLTQRTKIMKPLLITKTNDRYDVVASVSGGGISGQVEAVMYGIAKGLNVISEEYRTILKGEGLLTRDDRIVERKKYGKKKARKGTQYRKR
jgi:small subunit ribosomal protein S9